MNDPLIARFSNACGASAPLDLRVDLAGGGVLAEGSVSQPFTLVGRDDACDVTLTDPEVNLRHAWLQVVGGRVFAVDLGSRTGLAWPGGVRGSDWLDVGTPVRIGPFMLRLREPVTDKPSTFPPDYDPLASDPESAKVRTPVALEFRNGKRAKDRWTVNRLITLVGRSPDCKIHLTADDIAAYHCGLVSTRAGLWVVDLSGRGVVVNGERMRVAPLAHGTELWVGRFLIGCHYPSSGATPTVGRHAALTAPAPVAGLTDRARPLGAPPEPEDEVLLDSLADPATGLPSSHILADAFSPRGGANAGPPSNPIHVSGSGPAPVAALGATDLLTDPSAAPGGDVSVVPLLRQMGDLHARMSALFQHSLAVLEQLVGRVGREQLPVLRQELARIQELDVELTALQAEAARQTLVDAEAAVADPGRTAGGYGEGGEPEGDAASDTPAPQAASGENPGRRASASPRTPPPHHGLPAASHVRDRLNALALERNARWQSLIALFTDV